MPCARLPGEGLSPQARGKPQTVSFPFPIVGPIPAGTGETARKQRNGGMGMAYPRRHGGNEIAQAIRSGKSGLSPQARGKLAV